MTTLDIHGFLFRVTIHLDSSSPTSKISPSIAHALNLATIFLESGQLTCTANLVTPTIGGYYSSHLDFVVGYNLPADIVLGADWILACRPALDEDHVSLRRPPLGDLPPPHNWYPVLRAFVSFSYSHSTLTHHSAPVDLAQKIWGTNADARDALSSLINECYSNDMFCSDLLTSHKVSNDRDSRDARRDATLKHLLNGMCAALSSASCQLLAQSSISTAHLSHVLCTLLLDAHQDMMIDLDAFSLCCASVGFGTTTTSSRRELKTKLQRWLKHRKPLVECNSVIEMLNRLDGYSIGSLVELVHLHGMEQALSAKDTARDAVVSHLITGACNCMKGELCHAVCSDFPVSSIYPRTVDSVTNFRQGS